MPQVGKCQMPKTKEGQIPLKEDKGEIWLLFDLHAGKKRKRLTSSMARSFLVYIVHFFFHRTLLNLTKCMVNVWHIVTRQLSRSVWTLELFAPCRTGFRLSERQARKNWALEICVQFVWPLDDILNILKIFKVIPNRWWHFRDSDLHLL